MFSALPLRATLRNRLGMSVSCQQNANIFGLVERFGLAGHERPEILDRGSLGRNRRERFALVLCGVTNEMGAGTATRLEKPFAVQAMPTGVER